jgi:hypothetical protein
MDAILTVPRFLAAIPFSTERIMEELRDRLANLVEHIAGIMVRL